MTKKLIIMVLSIALMTGMLTYPMNANAISLQDVNSGDIFQPMYSNVNSFINNFEIDSQGKSSVYSNLSVRDADQARVDVYLERYTNGSWSTIKTWTTTENSTIAYIMKDWYVAKGYFYRMRSTGYAIKNGVVQETIYYISTSIYYS